MFNFIVRLVRKKSTMLQTALSNFDSVDQYTVDSAMAPYENLSALTHPIL